MKWAVEIQKTNLDRRNLIDLLGGLGFKVIDGIQFPAFTSPEIDRCVTAADVFDRAKKLCAAIAGPAHIDPDFALGVAIDFFYRSTQATWLSGDRIIDVEVNYRKHHVNNSATEWAIRN